MGVSAAVGIKSIQRGVTSAGTNQNVNTNVTIAAVNVAKSTVSFLGYRTPGSTTTGAALDATKTCLSLTNSTTLQIQKGTGSASGSNTAYSPEIAWEVIEWH